MTDKPDGKDEVSRAIKSVGAAIMAFTGAITYSIGMLYLRGTLETIGGALFFVAVIAWANFSFNLRFADMAKTETRQSPHDLADQNH